MKKGYDGLISPFVFIVMLCLIFSNLVLAQTGSVDVPAVSSTPWWAKIGFLYGLYELVARTWKTVRSYSPLTKAMNVLRAIFPDNSADGGTF
jgi:hypothetical protein